MDPEKKQPRRSRSRVGTLKPRADIGPSCINASYESVSDLLCFPHPPPLLHAYFQYSSNVFTSLLYAMYQELLRTYNMKRSTIQFVTSSTHTKLMIPQNSLHATCFPFTSSSSEFPMTSLNSRLPSQPQSICDDDEQ